MTRDGSFRILLAAALLAGCGEDAALDRTLATIERVRGEATLADEALERVGRAAPGESITIAEGGLARLTLDSGAWFLLDAGATATVVDEATVALGAGRAYAEAGEGEELFLTAGERTIRVSDASLSVEAGETLSLYVVRGEVSWTVADARGVARAGERLALTGSAGTTEPVTLWRDWTGGLARLLCSSGSTPSNFAEGTLRELTRRSAATKKAFMLPIHSSSWGSPIPMASDPSSPSSFRE